ncbi:NAD(P)-binding protein [Burkholderia sp. 22PA0099]|uniref:NAD(P)-binding protein n=1 Tax=Burkholderia sp. 22PA0099 TaxID=3237372 RepID=UPI0039C2B44F
MTAAHQADVLPLLALKVGPRQLDVNYRFSFISIRDQIVRAQMAVKALVDTGLIEPWRGKPPTDDNFAFQLAIFGAGIAGIAAALQAEEEGIRFVLVEKNRYPSGILASTADRYVSTSMYEWPNTTSDSHTYPLDKPVLLDSALWKALRLRFTKSVTIDTFNRQFKALVAKNVNLWRQNAIMKKSGDWLVEYTTLSEASRKDLAKTVTSGTDSMISASIDGGDPVALSLDYRPPKKAFRKLSIESDYLLYAIGYGKEAKTFSDQRIERDLEFDDFWKKDSIPKLALGFPHRPTVLIIGSGDGALQDALRCLFDPKVPHPLEIWHAAVGTSPVTMGICLASYPPVLTAMRRIQSYDGYTTSGLIWGNQPTAYRDLDAAFIDIATQLVSEVGRELWHNVSPLLRRDVEWISVIRQDDWFSKAYPLNRFLIYLIMALYRRFKPHAPYPGFDVSKRKVVSIRSHGNRRGGTVTFDDGSVSRHCDAVIYRGGLDRTAEQQVGLSGKDTGRIELGRIPPPVVPVSSTPSRTGTSGLPTAISVVPASTETA